MQTENQNRSQEPPANNEASGGRCASLCCVSLSDSERGEIAEILTRRSNELATFRDDLESHTKEKFNNFPGCVEMAITREIARLRGLRDKVKVPPSPQDDED